jgi:large subunit ribosomal protein L25
LKIKYMIKQVKLEVKSRDKGERAQQTRAEGYIPAVLYGAETDARNLKVVKNEFIRLYAQVGEANLVDLAIDGEDAVKVLIKDVQKDPVRDSIIHVDFYRVNMKNKIDVEIPLNFIGEARAVKELGGTLVKNMESIEVKCLPGNLIEKIDIDLSSLNTFDDYVRVKDVSLSSDFEIINHPEEVIVHVMAAEVEKEPEPKAEEAAEEEKKEDKATAEESGENKKNEKK